MAPGREKNSWNGSTTASRSVLGVWTLAGSSPKKAASMPTAISAAMRR